MKEEIEKLIEIIQVNHSQLTNNESDKFRNLFDVFHKYKKLKLDDLTWLKEVAGKFKIED